MTTVLYKGNGRKNSHNQLSNLQHTYLQYCGACVEQCGRDVKHMQVQVRHIADKLDSHLYSEQHVFPIM